jgi:dephospho-CoA kinase
MRDGLVVCFSGRMRSGKTSVTEALAGRLGWRRAAFGDYVRARLAQQGGDPTSREALQNLGQAMVDVDPEGLVRGVLRSAGFTPGDNLVVDGVRHVAIQTLITQLVQPSRSFLIYLAVDDAHARTRAEGRSEDRTELIRAEAHRVESDLSEALPSRADKVIDATTSLETVIQVCLDAIERFAASPGRY